MSFSTFENFIVTGFGISVLQSLRKIINNNKVRNFEFMTFTNKKCEASKRQMILFVRQATTCNR